MNDGNKIGWKYWFTIEGNVMDDYLNIENTLKGMFENACKLIVNEYINEPKFQLCVNTIKTTITHFNSKKNIRKMTINEYRICGMG